MRVPSVVLLTLSNPRERYWGELVELNPAGVTMRAIELNSLEDFLSQINEHHGQPLPLPTSFFPMHRVERIAMDERIGEVPAIAERFRLRTGVAVEQYLSQFER